MRLLLLALFVSHTAHAQTLGAERVGVRTLPDSVPATISISVTSEGDVPVPDACVWLAGASSQEVQTGLDGATDLVGVPAGRHRVGVSLGGVVQAEQMVTVKGWRATSRMHVSFQIGLRPGTVFGIITDEEGTTLPGATVFLPEIQRGAATGIDGEFLIEGVPPGEYAITVASVGFEPLTEDALRILVDRPTRFTGSLRLPPKRKGYAYDECPLDAHCYGRPLIQPDIYSRHVFSGAFLEHRPDRF